MERDNDPRAEAKELVNSVKSMLKHKDSLIYRVETGGKDDFDDDDDFALKALRAFSSGGANLDVWLEITGYNVSKADDIFRAHEWAELGRLNADIDTYSGDYRNGYNPTVEIHARFSY